MSSSTHTQLLPAPLAQGIGIVLACSASGHVLAQDTDKLEPVVVTASGYEQYLSDAPASISVITNEELNKKSYTDITDAVENIPGVFVTGGGGAKDISIRGMDSSYTLYLIDGRPISAGRSVNTNGSDGGKQIGLPPISMIERIEVIRGPMSSLYGSEAMGGVINIITKKVGDEWTGSITTEYTHSLNDINNDAQQVSVFTGGPLIPGFLGAQVHGSWQGTDESDYAGGSDNAESRPESKTKEGGGKLILTPDDDNEFTLGYTASTKEYTHTAGKSLPDDGTTSTTRYDKDIYTLTHSGSYGNLLVDSYLQRDISQRVQTQDKEETVDIFNSQATYFWGEHMLTFGGQYKTEELVDETNGLLTSDVPGAVRSVDRWIGALFLEAEWRLTDKLNVTTGARYDDDELFGGHVSPRVYANYHLNPQWTFKGGVSTGYKQPGLAAATEGFGRGTGGGGSPAPHPRALIIGNEDLDPETSTNYELGFVFNTPNRDFTSSLTLFHTQFKDRISEDRLCESPNADRNDPSTWTCSYAGNDYNFLSTYYNIDKAEMQGVELTLDYDITPTVRLSSSYTYTESEQKTGDFKGEPLTKMPKHMANVMLDWQTTDRLNLWLEGNYRSKTSDYLSRTSMSDGTPSYGFIDTGLVYGLTENTQLKAGLYNITSKEVTNDDYGVVLDGRQYNLGLTVNF